MNASAWLDRLSAASLVHGFAIVAQKISYKSAHYADVISLAALSNRMIVNESDLKTGDILLGYSGAAREKGEADIASGYVHAAIYLGESAIAEATGRKVKKSSFNDLAEEYDHLVALRQPDAWHGDNISKLHDFIDDRISSGASFNTQGIRDFKDSVPNSQSSDLERLGRYFEGELVPESPVRDKYFCSELVVSSYIAIGFIGESAAVVYRPENTSPESLAKDPTFGTFLGYIKPYGEYKIPEEDMFEHSTPFHEIFGK